MKKIFSMKAAKTIAAVFLYGITTNASAVTTLRVGSAADVSGSAAEFTTIQAAYNSIATPLSDAYVIELLSGYSPASESLPITFTTKSGASATNNITIRPASGVSQTITMTSSPSAPITSITTSAAANTTTKFYTASTGISVGMKIAGYGMNNNNQSTITDITDGVVTIGTTFAWNALYNGAYSTMIACPSSGTIYKNTTAAVNSTTLDVSSITSGIVAGMIVGGNAIQPGTTIVSATLNSPSAGKTRVVLSKSLVAGNQTTPTLYCTDAATGVYVIPTGFQMPVSSTTGVAVGMSVTGTGLPTGTTVVKVGSTDVYTSASGTFASSAALSFTSPGALITAIKFDGAKYVTIDGQSGGTGGTKNLTISNTLTYNNSSTILMINDASYNTVKYCTVLGSGVSSSATPASGTIYIATTTGTTARAGSAPNFTGSGNLYNTIDNCTIADASGGLPSIGVYLAGTSTYTNEGNAITNCNIANFFNPGAYISSGIYNDLNSQTTTITGNKLYQTDTRTYTGNGFLYPIYINTAGTLSSITDNVIGFSSSTGTGRMTVNTGASPSLTIAPRFAGIFINAYANGNNPTLQGNTISAIDFTSASAGSSAQGVAVGIYQQGGNLVAATSAKPNTISDINLYYTVSTTANFGLAGLSYSFSSGAANVGYTYVSGLSAIPVGTNTNSIIGKVIGIYTTGSYGGSSKINKVYNLSCGVSGSTAAHIVQGISINTGSNTANAIERNLVYNLNAISSGSSVISGLVCTAGTNVVTYKNNIVVLGNDVTSGFEIRGIYKSGTGADKIYHNTVYIGGTATGTTANTYAYYRNATTPSATGEAMTNNIFVNQRSGGSTGIHYAFKMLNSADYSGGFIASTYNLLRVGSDAQNKLAYIGADVADYTTFTSTYSNFATGCINDDPQFIDPIASTPNLIPSSAALDNTGADLSATVSDDFYGNSRSNTLASSNYPITDGSLILGKNDIGAVAFKADFPVVISPIQTKDVKLYSTTNAIVISGGNGKTAAIYSIDGKVLHMSKLNSDQTRITVQKGIYIVSLDNLKTKIRVQ